MARACYGAAITAPTGELHTTVTVNASGDLTTSSTAWWTMIQLQMLWCVCATGIASASDSQVHAPWRQGTLVRDQKGAAPPRRLIAAVIRPLNSLYSVC